MGTRGIRRLDRFSCCVSISTPVCGDITISVMASEESERASAAWDDTLTSAMVQICLHEVCLFESFQVKVSLQSDLAYGESPRQALTPYLP
jgi:hypothetical protein